MHVWGVLDRIGVPGDRVIPISGGAVFGQAGPDLPMPVEVRAVRPTADTGSDA